MGASSVCMLCVTELAHALLFCTTAQAGVWWEAVTGWWLASVLAPTSASPIFSRASLASAYRDMLTHATASRYRLRCEVWPGGRVRQRKGWQ